MSLSSHFTRTVRQTPRTWGHHSSVTDIPVGHRFSTHCCDLMCSLWKVSGSPLFSVFWNPAVHRFIFLVIVLGTGWICPLWRFMTFSPGEIFLKDFIYLFLERGERREKGRETSMCGCFLCAPNWGLGPQPRHVAWLETLWFSGQPSIHWATPARASSGKFLNVNVIIVPCQFSSSSLSQGHLIIQMLSLLHWSITSHVVLSVLFLYYIMP